MVQVNIYGFHRPERDSAAKKKPAFRFRMIVNLMTEKDFPFFLF